MGVAENFEGVMGYVFSGAVISYLCTFVYEGVRYKKYSLFPGVKVYSAWFVASIIPIIVYGLIILLGLIDINNYPSFIDFIGEYFDQNYVDDHVVNNASAYNFLISSLIISYLIAACFLPRDIFLFRKKSVELKVNREDVREIISISNAETWWGIITLFISVIIASGIWIFGVFSILFKDPFICNYTSSTFASVFFIGNGVCSSGYMLFAIPILSIFTFFIIPFFPFAIISLFIEIFAKDMPLRRGGDYDRK